MKYVTVHIGPEKTIQASFDPDRDTKTCICGMKMAHARNEKNRKIPIAKDKDKDGNEIWVNHFSNCSKSYMFRKK